MKVLQNGFDDDKYAPAPLLEEYVEQGKLGRKSKEGFYIY
jgi:3-hydroxybutyryl-CoA dehydrogenase